MIILVDQDDVLADFHKEFSSMWVRQCPPRVYVPPEKQVSHDIAENYPDFLHSVIRKIYESPGFVLNLPPIEGSLESIEEMLEMGFDIRICTSPLNNYENCVLEKYQWVERYLGREFTKKMILTKDKTLVCGDFLIDDKPEVKGVIKPRWEHVVFNQPWNQNSKATKRLNHWKDWKKVLGV